MFESNPPTSPRWAQWSLVILFVTTLCLPAVTTRWLGSSLLLIPELRPAKDLPAFPRKTSHWKQLPTDLENALIDRIGFRREALQIRLFWKYGLLGQLPSGLVVLGRNHWLYLDSSHAMRPHWDERLRQRIVQTNLDHLRQRRDWLAARGIPLGVVIAPEKQTIHPENAPNGFLQHWTEEIATFNQELARNQIQPGAEFDLIDWRPTLRRIAQSGKRLTYRTDSHWNLHGLVNGLGPVVDRLRGTRNPTESGLVTSWVDHFQIGSNASQNQPLDLSRIAGLAEPWIQQSGLSRPFDEPFDSLISNHPHAIVRPDASDSTIRHYRCEAPSVRNRPRVVLLHDSFFVSAVSLLARECPEILGVYQNEFPVKLIEEFKPDLVIQALSERWFLAPQSPRLLPPPQDSSQPDPSRSANPSWNLTRPFEESAPQRR